MDYIIISSILLTFIIIISLILGTKKPIKKEKKKPTILRPSYWITPKGVSWVPPPKHNLGPGGLPPQ